VPLAPAGPCDEQLAVAPPRDGWPAAIQLRLMANHTNAGHIGLGCGFRRELDAEEGGGSGRRANPKEVPAVHRRFRWEAISKFRLNVIVIHSC